MFDRLSRLRRTPALRELVRETSVRPTDLIYPVFVREGAESAEPILSMPGQMRHPVSDLARLARDVRAAGVRALLLFGVTDRKDERAAASSDASGVVQQAIRAIKEATPDMVVMTDVCVCAYTPHGHCGIVSDGAVDNDATLPLLASMAVSHAVAGADIVAPSSMMDGQVAAIRRALDEGGHNGVAIMGYSAKFASAFYGPFRDAAGSAPSFGDRASYQHDFGNRRHSRREILADVSEGADIVMVKPGLAYLDVVSEARSLTDLPVAAYSVSGEYSMIKAASERGWLDERAVVLESLAAFKRAGADLIITYFAKEASEWINRS